MVMNQWQNEYQRQEELRKQQGQVKKRAAHREATIDASSNFQWDYPGLKVYVRNDMVLRPDRPYGQWEWRVLGDLAGAKADMTSKTRRIGMTVAATATLGLPGLAALASGKATAFILFRDGTLHTTELKGNKAIRQAELDIARFNAAAGSETPAEQ